jgi:tetratricopeptide (TPR) repeat protein
MTNVAPGDYTIYAFAGVSQGAPEQSKEYMAQYKGRGRAIQLRASETLRLELDVIGDSAANIDERLADSGPPEISNRIVRTPDMPMVTEQASPPTPQRGRGARGARGTTAAPVTRGQRGDAAGVAALREALAGGLNTAAERTNVLNLITQNVNALMTPANERTFVERALQTAQTLEPNNPLWPSQLGRLYATAAEFPSLSDLSLTPAQAATKAVESFEKAATLGDTGQTSEIAEAARRANLLDKAETYAKQALAGRPDDVHAANRTLGLIALQQGDVAAAKRYLLASGNVAGSPVLRSFGPTMNLATELLNKGERETVIAYLERCLTFWTSGEEQLKGWIESLKSGGTPVLRSSTGR